MVRLSYRLLAAVGASALAGALFATPPATDPPSERNDSADSVESLAEAYWSDRAGRLPPNRPVTVRPAPQRSRHASPGPGQGRRPVHPEITVPASRSR